MQVAVESLGGLQRRMTVQVPAEQIQIEIDKRLRRVGKTAKIKGFRPGKVPFNVVRQRYGNDIRREVLEETLRSSYAEAVSQEKLEPAGGPKIETSGLEQDDGLQYTATFEVYPEIILKKVEGLKVERKVAEIGDSDIDQVLENLRMQRAHYHAAERAAAEDDKVTVDFSATIDGEPFEGGEGEGAEVIVGSGQMPEFEQAVSGAVAGGQVKAAIEFPATHHVEALAGKTAQFDITVKEVGERHLPEVDEDFCKSFGVEGGVESLRDGIRDNITRERDEKVRGLLRAQLLEELVKHNPVELPQALIDQEVDYLRGDAARRMGIDDPDQMPPADQFVEAGRRRVALGLLVAKVVETAELQADQASIDARLQAMARQLGDPEQIMRAYRNDPRLMGQIEMAVLEEKAIDWLLERAKTKDRKTTFQELMQIEG
ncbi:MAG: trigger factor [Gammaproteobacteria bacterium]|nr:trigger factor [Gammaproteobacteria bacterium]